MNTPLDQEAGLPPAVPAPLPLVPPGPPAEHLAGVDLAVSLAARRAAVLLLRREAHTVRVAEQRMRSAVQVGRDAGLSWDNIGAATGTSGETLRRRHA